MDNNTIKISVAKDTTKKKNKENLKEYKKMNYQKMHCLYRQI